MEQIYLQMGTSILASINRVSQMGKDSTSGRMEAYMLESLKKD